MAVNEMSQAYIRTYESNLIHLVQQKMSKLRGTVTVRGTDSADHQFQVMSAQAAADIKDGTVGTNLTDGATWTAMDTVLGAHQFNNRVATPTPKYVANAFRQSDISRMLIDPKSALLQAQAMALGRKIDNLIYLAAYGNALDSLGTVNTLAGAQLIGGAAIAPSFSYVTNVKENMLENDIDPTEECFIVVTPNFVVALLSDAKATSIDYINGKALMEGGIVQGWMGFTWICMNGLTSPGGAGPYQRYGIAYTRDAIGLKINQDVQTTVDRIPQKQNATLVQSSMDLGAVRIQDSKVFRLHYLETN